jgi:hypothetical protein
MEDAVVASLHVSRGMRALYDMVGDVALGVVNPLNIYISKSGNLAIAVPNSNNDDDNNEIVDSVEEMRFDRSKK